MAPTTTNSWSITGTSKENWDSLEFKKDVPLPQLGDYDVLVQIEAVSLNFRDLAIPKGLYPFPVSFPRVPASHRARLAVGPKVTQLAEGDNICTLFNQHHQSNPITPLASKALKPGDVVLTQGTGGVSLSAIQFAVAAGATVIATTSSAAKGEQLKKLGAHHVINYKETPNWGEVAKGLTPGGAGADHIIEDQPTLLDALANICTIRGLFVGSKQQFDEMNQAIDANKIKPVVDQQIFGFEEVKEAYQYQWDQKHFGKVVVKI
uniref:Alcohol dehydrogenase, putative n=1 Tax=Colletotrichum fructicola (strain Nara gc5) TaxID=1213859 RepID=L2FIP6_COLFN